MKTPHGSASDVCVVNLLVSSGFASSQVVGAQFVGALQTVAGMAVEERAFHVGDRNSGGDWDKPKVGSVRQEVLQTPHDPKLGPRSNPTPTTPERP